MQQPHRQGQVAPPPLRKKDSFNANLISSNQAKTCATPLYTYTHTLSYEYIYKYIFEYIRIHIRICVRIYTNIYTNVFEYVLEYILIYTNKRMFEINSMKQYQVSYKDKTFAGLNRCQFKQNRALFLVIF